MSEIEEAGRALLGASEALEAALESGSSIPLADAVAARENAFAAFAEACEPWAGDPPETASALARRVLEIDARINERACRARRDLRAELEGVSAWRRAQAAGRDSSTPPRFLSRRV